MITVIAKKKKFDLEDELKLLSKVRDSLKESSVAKEICDEHGFSLDIIDGIPIDFEDEDELDASAKTVDARIFLNSNLMNEEFNVLMRYAIHELVHALQHMRSGEVGSVNFGKKEKKKKYLDQEAEIKAFQKQVVFQEETKGTNDVVKYIKELLEYHEIPKEDRFKYAKRFLKEIDDPKAVDSILKSLEKVLLKKPKKGNK